MKKRYGDAYTQDEALEHSKHFVGAGWHLILERLIPDLFALGWDGRLLQVKEKFGGLRFYIEGGTDEIYARISQACAEAWRTCETCGQPGRPRPGGWVQTLCDEHAKK